MPYVKKAYAIGEPAEHRLVPQEALLISSVATGGLFPQLTCSRFALSRISAQVETRNRGAVTAGGMPHAPTRPSAIS